MATCPECDAEIEIDDDDLDELQVGDPFECDECGSALRVATLAPLEFDIDEDLDDEDEDEDEDGDDAEDDLDDLDGEDEDDEDGDDNWDE